MYTPPAFTVTDPKTIHDFVTENNFGVLVTAAAGDVPVATHLPFLFDWAHGPHGRLCAHMARANPQWRLLQDMHGKVEEVLVIFAGAHGYVSPRYYDPGPAVPTWNYQAAHIYGVPRLVEDDAEIRDTLAKLSAHHEADAPDPWRMDKEDPAFIEKMVAAIVAFEIDITRIEMKSKMSQNKTEETQEKVIRMLQSSVYAQDRFLAAAMKKVSKQEKRK